MQKYTLHKTDAGRKEYVW